MYICQKVYSMQRHCRDRHGWVNPQPEGGNSRTKYGNSQQQIWIDVPQFQQLFRAREWRRLFEVQQVIRPSSEEPVDIIQSVENRLQRRQQEIEDSKKRKAIQKNMTRCKADPWLDFTGWDSHLAGFNREELVSLMQPAAGEEGKDQDAVYDADLCEEGLITASRTTRRVIRQAL